MMLSELIKAVKGAKISGDASVAGICYSSAAASKGSCFVALKGVKSDGHAYINDAILRGASCVVCESGANVPAGVAHAIVLDSREAMGEMSAAFFGDPSNSMKLIGLTGTNGKTTTTYLLESIFKSARMSSGVIGTIEYRFAGESRPASHTTPESVDLQRLLCEMKEKGVAACSMEVSSHALSQHRVAGCKFDAAIFTNLTPEHLDYHNDMEEYFAAKAILFERSLAKSGKNSFAIVNLDDEYGRRLVDRCPVDVWTYGIEHNATVRGSELGFGNYGLSMKVETPVGAFNVRSKLFGRFNALNILAATACALKMGIPLEDVRAGVEDLDFVPGRFQAVENKSGVLAIVDYAHTPDALENVLTYASELARLSGGKLITVFGCGGDRDKLKRPVMGIVAGKLSDVVIATSDNPRTEDPETIISEIVHGLRGASSPFNGTDGYEVIADRKAAICRAVEVAKKNDVILVAGKGHEDYQIFGTKKIHFDDKEVLAESFGRKVS